MKTMYVDTSEKVWRETNAKVLSSTGGTVIHLQILGSRYGITVHGPDEEVDLLIKKLKIDKSSDVIMADASRLLRKIAADDWEDSWNDEDNILLHVSDWNYQDKYYIVPRNLLEEVHNQLSKDLEEGWQWLIGNVDYGDSIEDKDLPIKSATTSVDMTLDEYFLDYNDPELSLSEWELAE